MNGKDFGILMATVQSVFEVKAKDKAGFKVWYDALKDLEYPIANQAVSNLIKTKSGFLSPAEIRQEYAEILNPTISFTEAYKVLRHATESIGRYQYDKAKKYIEDNAPSIIPVVKSIGFMTLCNTDPSFTRGTVERMYKEVKQHGEEELLKLNFQKDIDDIKRLELRGFQG